MFVITLIPPPSCTYSVGHNEVIGVCRVGNDADNLGRNHWSEMLTYPRKPVAHWHPLVEVSLFYCDWFDMRFHVQMAKFGTFLFLLNIICYQDRKKLFSMQLSPEVEITDQYLTLN